MAVAKQGELRLWELGGVRGLEVKVGVWAAEGEGQRCGRRPRCWRETQGIRSSSSQEGPGYTEELAKGSDPHRGTL